MIMKNIRKKNARVSNKTSKRLEGIFKQTGRHYAGIKQTASGVPLTQVVNASGRKDTTASGGGKDGGRTLVKSSHPVPGSGFTAG